MKILTLLFLISSICLSENIDISKYFSNCNQILDNGLFKSCYNYNYKSVTTSYIELTDSSNGASIKEKYPFYEDKNIPIQFRASSSDWTNTGKDRGHIQSDASNDYSKESLYLTYAVSNITMQFPITNRRSFLEIEKLERKLVNDYKNINVLTIIEYTTEKINGVGLPSKYTKIFWNDSFKECYSIKNDNISYSIGQMKINCNDIP